MTYTLVGSLTSPYVRRLRLYMRDIPHKFEIINYLDKSDDESLSAWNPLKRIPVLLIDGKPLWETRIIHAYLHKHHGRGNLSLAEENLISTVDTIQDQMIQTFLLQRFNHPVDRANPYYKRMAQRLELSLAYFDKDAAHGVVKRWDYPAIALYTLLDWAIFRQQLKVADLGPALERFYEESAGLPLVADTDPRKA